VFVTDATVLTDIAAALKQVSKAAWLAKNAWAETAVGLPHLQAYNQIVSGLTSRGYTLAQVLAWDRGSEFERVFALYWFLVENSLLSEAGAKFIEKYERYEKWLATETLTSGGDPLVPGGTAGQVTTGALDTSSDLFGLDPDDSRIGYPSRF
jgi:hypothetical protein